MTLDFASPRLVSVLAQDIRTRTPRPLRLMEVCGTHTMSISRYSLRQLLAGHVDLLSGPGCPVCVTANTDLDRMLAIARVPDTIIATFGDMLRVPGSYSSLAAEKTAGADIQVVYSPLDAVALAAAAPGRRVVFLGIGFETTAPAVAAAVELAARQGLTNFFVYSAHKTLPAALRFLLADDIGLNGLLLPGHVCAVTGRRAYDFLAAEYGVPAVVAGFTPVEILQAVRSLADLINQGESAVLNAYARVVREDGNPAARNLIDRVFVPADAAWRGIGVIPASGLALAPAYAAFDAARAFPAPAEPTMENPACRCGLVIRGKLKPPACSQFARACTPLHPVGPCMVSSEGACAAYYKYERHTQQGGGGDAR